MQPGLNEAKSEDGSADTATPFPGLAALNACCISPPCIEPALLKFHLFHAPLLALERIQPQIRHSGRVITLVLVVDQIRGFSQVKENTSCLSAPGRLTRR
jgi:hypothetical protein